MISAVKAMSCFLGNLNHPSKLGTTQGSGPTPGRLPLSSIFLVVASSPAVVVDVLQVVAGSPAPPTGQDQGASG